MNFPIQELCPDKKTFGLFFPTVKTRKSRHAVSEGHQPWRRYNSQNPEGADSQREPSCIIISPRCHPASQVSPHPELTFLCRLSTFPLGREKQHSLMGFTEQEFRLATLAHWNKIGSRWPLSTVMTLSSGVELTISFVS